MVNRAGLTTLILASILEVSAIWADEVKYYNQDGLLYQETRRVVQRPVVETRLEEREQTVYREQLHTDLVETTQTYNHPVTEYRWVAVMQGRWNPLVQPYYTQQLLPVQTWQARQHIVRTPVQRRELIPEKRVVRVPVTSQRLAQEEVISRVVVGPARTDIQNIAAAPTNSPAPMSSPAMGGVSQFDNDPPRRSVQIPRATPVLR